MERPFSQACENNKEPILAVLKRHFGDVSRVLEVGSGTGQHAVFFAEHLPHLQWQTADRPEHLPGIRQWLEWAGVDNVLPPLQLDVNDEWPSLEVDAVFSANTLHIMSWPEVERFFAKLGTILNSGAMLCVYGPFNYGGEYTSTSNAQFDQWLKGRDPLSGIRDIEAVSELAATIGLTLLEDCAMPANNRCLVWKKSVA